MLNRKRMALWLGTGVAALTLSLTATTHPVQAQSPMPGPGSFPGGSSTYPGPGGLNPRGADRFRHAIQELDKVAAHLRSAPGDYGGHRDRALALIEQAKRELRRAADSRGGTGFPGRPGGTYPGQGTQPYPGH